MNGFAGGAVNGAISVGFSSGISPYISNGIGGSTGSRITDLLNNTDRTEEKKKSVAEMYYSARVAGGTRFILGGAFASLWTWQTGGMNIANIVGMDRLTTALWDIFIAGGISYSIGTGTSVASGEIWDVKENLADNNAVKKLKGKRMR